MNGVSETVQAFDRVIKFTELRPALPRNSIQDLIEFIAEELEECWAAYLENPSNPAWLEELGDVLFLLVSLGYKFASARELAEWTAEGMYRLNGQGRGYIGATEGINFGVSKLLHELSVDKSPSQLSRKRLRTAFAEATTHIQSVVAYHQPDSSRSRRGSENRKMGLDELAGITLAKNDLNRPAEVFGHKLFSNLLNNGMYDEFKDVVKMLSFISREYRVSCDPINRKLTPHQSRLFAKHTVPFFSKLETRLLVLQQNLKRNSEWTSEAMILFHELGISASFAKLDLHLNK